MESKLTKLDREELMYLVSKEKQKFYKLLTEQKARYLLNTPTDLTFIRKWLGMNKEEWDEYIKRSELKVEEYYYE